MTNYQKFGVVFDEWNHQYAKNPEKFSRTLNEDGSPKYGYGEEATNTLIKMAKELNIDLGI